MAAFMQGGIGQIVSVNNQFHAHKALFKVPKIWNINFSIENDPPPLSDIPEVSKIHAVMADNVVHMFIIIVLNDFTPPHTLGLL